MLINCMVFNSLPNDKNFARFKLKAFADDKSNVAKRMFSVFKLSPDKPILGSSNSAANKDIRSKISTNGNTIT